MTRRPGPDWLAEQQARFGSVLRTPLDRSSGTLRAAIETYPRSARRDVQDGARATGAERLAVYNRQYWFRLFGALQSAHPLTSRLLGAWAFNAHAAAFLSAHAPTGWDLERAGDGFDAFLAQALDAGDLLVEAARLDVTWRRLFHAAPATPFRPPPAQAARLLDARLVRSPSAAILVERWPLLDLQRKLPTLTEASPLVVPPPLDEPRGWVLVREDAGIRQLALEPREAELLTLLGEHTVRDALARLEARCAEGERVDLPPRAQRWIARSATLGLWSDAVLESGRTRLSRPRS